MARAMELEQGVEHMSVSHPDMSAGAGPSSMQQPQEAEEWPPQPRAALDGYLVAAVAASDIGLPATEPDLPWTSSSEDEEEQAAKVEFSPASDVFTRELSFRKTSADKQARAKELQARSSSLTSFLVTPAMHSRSLPPQDEGTHPALGSRTVGSSWCVARPAA